MKKGKNRAAQKGVLIGIFTLVFLLCVLKVLAANFLATTGSKIDLLEQQTSSLDQESSLIAGQIADLSSLSRISSETKGLGLTKPASVVDLTVEIPIALR